MRKLMGFTLASTAVLAIACGRSKPTDTSAMSADLKRDLQLASASQNLRINPDEIAPKSKQELALKPKAAPSGPKVVRANHPKVKASPKPQEVAEIKTDIPQVQVMASAPAPSETPAPDAPPLARPAPVPAQSYPTTSSIPTTNAGSGGILGGIFGAVIRGGIVGDDDHCDPRTMPRRGRPIGGDVYGGGMRGVGNIGMPGGMGRPRY